MLAQDLKPNRLDALKLVALMSDDLPTLALDFIEDFKLNLYSNNL